MSSKFGELRKGSGKMSKDDGFVILFAQLISGLDEVIEQAVATKDKVYEECPDAYYGEIRFLYAKIVRFREAIRHDVAAWQSRARMLE
jgi:hypothetical protein